MSGDAVARWGDLGPRVASALVMMAVGAAALWSGGLVFALLVAALVGLMLWELARMVAPADDGSGVPVATGVGGTVAFVVFHLNLPGWPGLAALALIVPVLGWRFARPRARAWAYVALILFAGAALIALRDGYGMWWVLWLVAVVIASDMAGYFAGRLLGGPKFWPAISPKKTWSGTVAGWLAAAAVGAAFLAPLQAGAGLVLLSVLVALAGQMGDIAESAMKRRAGVKDSSNLIPGHGGVLDRFDAMIAAAVAFLVCDALGLVGAVLRGGVAG